ncbi:MAG: hypothetical protein LBU88_06365 [Treponema sp.]|jgi:two-component system chemotaxis sensor kinase CheA|nr:hypothetical protein [Treponema sp.]
MAMDKKNIENTRSRRIANVSSILLFLFMSAVYVFEILFAGIRINYSLAGLIFVISLAITVAIIRNTINYYKLAFNVPLFIQLYYTAIMFLDNWHSSHYLLVCVALFAISCLYSSFYRTAAYIFAQNVLIAVLVIRGHPIAGQDVSLNVVLVSWGLCLFGSIIMLQLTRSATIVLSKAIENRDSFRDLLDTTENFIAMVNSNNEVVYSSRTLSSLGNLGDPALAEGRPLIDLFPGKSLKILAGKLLKQKEDYTDDWEFSLDGQKRFFKAVSHSLLGGSEGTLISLYDMTHLAERDEIAAMKDSMKIGLFFMDKDHIIQDHYSRYLEEMLSDTRLFGKTFTDIINDSVTPSEMEAIKDYFKMVFERSYDQDMLDDINPLTELHYENPNTGIKKVFQFEFNTVERGQNVFILATVYDITVRVELQQRLEEEEARRQEEMQSVFELIQVSPDVFKDFMQDTEHEFATINKTFKDESLSTHEALVKVYQSVHAVKSNAVILGLNVFGNKVHNLESKIKKLREFQGEVPFNDMLKLTMDIDKLSIEKDGFKDIIKKLESYVGTGTAAADTAENQNINVLIDSLNKAAAKGAEDLEKKIKFVAGEIDKNAINNGPRRTIKEILMQLVRNSVVHGIESPDVRAAKGKNETGVIKLSVSMSPDNQIINMRLTDDGKGLDYKKIAERAIKNGVLKPEEATNKDNLIKAIFSPGFSTAETEGVHGGRGIGLNLVRDRIKEANGNIKIKSEIDKGTIFFVTIPINQKDQPQ